MGGGVERINPAAAAIVLVACRRVFPFVLAGKAGKVKTGSILPFNGPLMLPTRSGSFEYQVLRFGHRVFPC